MSINKYNNSKIYKIISNQEPSYYYIGSTVSDLNTRLQRHKSNSKIYPNNKKSKYFNEINWDVKIYLIENVNVSNKSELLEYENEFIKKYLNDNLCLNTYYSKLNIDLRKKKTNDNSNKYYAKNIDEMKKKHNQYYIKTKDEKKKIYEENKEVINQKRLEKIVCECGISTSKNNYSRHIKTKSHNDALEKKNS